MKPHPHIRKTVKWGGAVVTVLLVVAWVGSGWRSPQWGMANGYGAGFNRGYLLLSKGRTLPTWRVYLGKVPERVERFGWGFHTVTYTGRFAAYGPGGAIYLPMWAVVLPLMTVTIVAWRLDILARRIERMGRCPKCNYDRAGIAVVAVCPECGERGPGS